MEKKNLISLSNILVNRSKGVEHIELVYNLPSTNKDDFMSSGTVITNYVDIWELCKRFSDLPAVVKKIFSLFPDENISNAEKVLKELGYSHNVGGNVRRGYKWVFENFTINGILCERIEIFNRLLSMNSNSLSKCR